MSDIEYDLLTRNIFGNWSIHIYYAELGLCRILPLSILLNSMGANVVQHLRPFHVVTTFNFVDHLFLHTWVWAIGELTNKQVVCLLSGGSASFDDWPSLLVTYVRWRTHTQTAVSGSFARQQYFLFLARLLFLHRQPFISCKVHQFFHVPINTSPVSRTTVTEHYIILRQCLLERVGKSDTLLLLFPEMFGKDISSLCQ